MLSGCIGQKREASGVPNRMKPWRGRDIRFNAQTLGALL